MNDLVVIYIHVEGGVIQGIFTPEPQMVRVIVEDRDDDLSLSNPFPVEFADEDSIEQWVGDVQEQIESKKQE